MYKICVLLIKDTLTINLHNINCFNKIFSFFPQYNTNLADISINIGILIFLNTAPPQNLVFAPGAPIQINTVFGPT